MMDNKGTGPPPAYGQPAAAQGQVNVTVNQPMGGGGMMVRAGPPDYSGMALLTCLFCFWPVSLVALYFSYQTKSLTACGDIAGAEKASSKTKILSFVSIGIGIVMMITLLIVIILAATGSLYAANTYSSGIGSSVYDAASKISDHLSKWSNGWK